MNGKLLCLALGLVAGTLRANSFFAMDTAVRSLDELDTVKQLGYDGIGWISAPPGQLTNVLRQLRQRDLKLFALYDGANLTDTNLIWGAQLEADLNVLRGTDTLIWLPIHSEAFAKSSPAGDAVAVPSLQHLAGLAASNGLRVALYPHTGMWLEHVADAQRVAKLVNRPNVGITFNLCHCLRVGDEAKIPELLTAAVPSLFAVTINGADANAAGAGWNRLIQPLDAGSYDVGMMLRELRALNYQGPIGLQGYGVNLPAKDNLERSMAAWHKLAP